jgi:Dyp-type peroxidase family
MIKFKYFDGVRKAQAEQGRLEDMPRFDLARLRSAGGIKDRISGLFLDDPRWWLKFLRRWWPIARIGGFAIVTRDADVREVLEREGEFTTPYGPEMTEMAGGANFVLGMQDGPDYRKLKKQLLLAFPPAEVEARVRPIAERHARDIMNRASPGFDAIGGLFKVVPVRICREYFGMIVDDENEFSDWSVALSSIFFSDPTASRTTRELAIVAADRLTRAVDRSIAAVRSGAGQPDTPLARMVAMMSQGNLTLKELHSVMLGMISGFAPTNLLAGGNCLEVILSNHEALDAVKRAIGADDTAALDRAVQEAMRFKPIWVGPWRYASSDLRIAAGTSREKLIPQGTTVMPATLSAMFDPDAVERPDEFDPDRPRKTYMVYGHGIHVCIGAEVARVQIGECLRAIFARKGVRRMPGRAGRTVRLGAFPEHLRIDFERDAIDKVVPQSLVTVVLPLKPGTDLEQLRAAIADLGNPAGATMRSALDATELIHFASIAVVETGKTDPVSRRPEGVVAVEISGDGSSADVLSAFSGAVGNILWPTLSLACANPAGLGVDELLEKHSLDVSPAFGSTAGLVFAGTPGHSVARIRAEARLADEIQDVVETPHPHDPLGAAGTLARARKHLSSVGGYDFAFRAPESLLEKPAGSAGQAILATLAKPGLAIIAFGLVLLGGWLTYMNVFGPTLGPAPTLLGSATSFALGIVALIFVGGLGFAGMAWLLHGRGGAEGGAGAGAGNPLRWILLAALALVGWGLVHAYVFGPFDDPARNFFVTAASLILAIIGVLVILAAVVGGIAWLLQRWESRDRRTADSVRLKDLEQIQVREDHTRQNHLTAVSVMKPGRLRLLTLRFAFYLIMISAQKAFRPGYLSNINSIHFARWVLIPGSDRLVFFSNYGGSWESYLEDFIAKASEGLTGVWSNTVGYPRANFLFFDGARDGDRFKRWARRQQVPTLFWYSAYRDLTTQRIRINSRIRRGICWAQDSEARNWVSLFGSRPRPRIAQTRYDFGAIPTLPAPPEPLESGEIQSIFFNAFGALDHGMLMAFSVPEGLSRQARLEWLEFLAAKTSFGDVTPRVSAMTIGLGPKGLLRLGLDAGQDADAMRRFPNAFLQGMGHPERSRILDDSGTSRPDEWRWGSGARPGDMIVSCYAKSAGLLKDIVDDVGRRATTAGLVPVAEILLTINRDVPGALERAASSAEPDQAPVNRDAKPRAREQFGFVDGISQPAIRGTARAHAGAPASNVVAAGEFLFGYRDEHGFYPISPAVKAANDSTGILASLRFRRGADGVSEALHDFGRNGSFLVVRQFEQHVESFNDYCSFAAAAQSRAHDNPSITPEWIAAKMMGRWRDGSSLVRNPEGRPRRGADNDFSYGVEDPQGLRCPFGAHIRRSNPRDSLGDDHAKQIQIGKRHRILRVGRTYEVRTEAGAVASKGLLFMCLNADIERQYEFMQQTWVASDTFHGLNGEKDPTIGSSEGKNRFTIPTWEGSVVLKNMPSFVTTRGGGYFFMPSRSAVRYLVTRLRSS